MEEITQGRHWHIVYTLKLETLISYEKNKLKNDGYTKHIKNLTYNIR